MKTTAVFTFILVLLSVIFSCERADPNEKGRLEVKIYYNGESVGNAIVSIATSKKNLNLGTYIKQVHANQEGVADFGALDPGTYYCDAFKYINNNEDYLYGFTVVTVEPGHRKSIELSIEKK